MTWSAAEVWTAVVMLVAAIRVLDVLIRPWARCPVCGGTGRHGLSTRDAFGSCLACRKHPGRRVRLGARTVRRVIMRKEL